MPYGITQCYRGDIPALIPAEAGTRLSDPGDAVCRTRRDWSAAYTLLTLTLGGGDSLPLAFRLLSPPLRSSPHCG